MSNTTVTENGVEKLLPRLMTGIIMGVVVVAVFLFYFDLSKIMETLLTIPVWVYLLALASTIGAYVIRYYKWNWMLKKLSVDLPSRDSLSIFLIGLAMSITPGKAGELLKAYLIKRKTNTEMSRSASAIFVDRLTDLIALLGLISFGISLFPGGQVFFAFFLIFGVGLIFLLRSPKLARKVLSFLTRWGFLKRYRGSLFTFYDSTYQLLTLRTFCPLLFLTLLSWLLESLSLYLFAEALGLDLTYLHYVLILSFGTLAGAVTFLPGGLGVAEGSVQGMLTFFGVFVTTAASLTLLIRLVTLWLGVFVGLTVFFWKRKEYL